MNKPQWIRDQVKTGDRIAGKFGIPTINLTHPERFPLDKRGVYACRISIEGTYYPGVLFIGPRLILDQKKTVLEIHVIGYTGRLYGREIMYYPVSYLRPVRDFLSLSDLFRQIRKDIRTVKQLFTDNTWESIGPNRTPLPE